MSENNKHPWNDLSLLDITLGLIGTGIIIGIIMYPILSM